MPTISVINYKGGVGKTTVTANLAAELGYRGKRVLAIDLDPQASLTFSFFSVDEWRNKFEKSKTIKNWYDAFIDKDTELNLKNLIVQPKRATGTKNNLHLICSHLALINVDLELATRLIGGTERDLRNNYLRVHSRLRNGLESVDGEYDFILIDCPPNFNIVTKTAVTASDYLLVPTKPDYLSTLGIEQLEKHVDQLLETYNKYVSDSGNNSEWDTIDPETLGILFTMIQIRNDNPISAQQPYIEQVRKLGVPIFDTLIRENKTIYADAPEYGVPVVLQRVSGQTYRNVQSELEDLTTEILRKI